MGGWVGGWKVKFGGVWEGRKEREVIQFDQHHVSRTIIILPVVLRGLGLSARRTSCQLGFPRSLVAPLLTAFSFHCAFLPVWPPT